jgi:hypothetical protein
MGKTFEHINAAMVGNFERGIGEKIPQWLKANGGTFSRDINPSVTHLITTEEAFTQNGEPGTLLSKFLGGNPWGNKLTIEYSEGCQHARDQDRQL